MSRWQRGHFHSVVGYAAGRSLSGRGPFEQSAAEWQHVGSSAVGEEAEVADTGKSARQDVLHEAAQELFEGKCHGALLAVVSVVFPAEADCG